MTLWIMKLQSMSMPGGVMLPPSPTGFSSFSQELEELLFQTKFSAAGLFLGNLSMKKFFILDLPSWL